MGNRRDRYPCQAAVAIRVPRSPNVLGTEVYLKATPQLLELASSRFEAHLRRSRRPR